MTSLAGAREELSIRRPVILSAAAHLVVVGLLVTARTSHRAPAPPVYRVSLIAAAPGPRAIGDVAPPDAPAAAKTAPAAPPPSPRAARATPPPSRMAAPPARGNAPSPARVATTAPARGAPPAAKPGVAPSAPVAGGGSAGGRGADVANVHVDGIAFPYPGYLDNVVRQIALRFAPRGGSSLTAVVAFLIRRDGSVSGMRLTTRSGVYAFDTEAMGAVDAAAQARAFGPLPQGFSDDVLPVIFSFDPRLIR